jgi:hypothetical protein
LIKLVSFRRKDRAGDNAINHARLDEEFFNKVHHRPGHVPARFDACRSRFVLRPNVEVPMTHAEYGQARP